MKPEELKLYQKYKYKDWEEEYIYIGNSKKYFYFLYKRKNLTLPREILSERNFDIQQTIKDLNLELNEDGEIKDYYLNWFIVEEIKNLKPSLKERLQNILNR